MKRLISRESWPNAISPDHFINPHSDQQRYLRAQRILDWIELDLKGKNVLHLMTEYGDVPFYMNHRAKVIAYDHVNHGWTKFPSKENVTFTDNFQTVEDRAPFDFIFMYMRADACMYLQNIVSLLKKEGAFQMRHVPWGSRISHTNLRNLNKAYAGIFLGEEDLLCYGCKPNPKLGEPDLSGFRIRFMKKRIIPVEPIFSAPVFQKSLKKLNLSNSLMETVYTDYVLEKL